MESGKVKIEICKLQWNGNPTIFQFQIAIFCFQPAQSPTPPLGA
jgi:hypothetical protein